jgi:ubiquinone/menaquinone biosynthesis C-methylase UbiE
MLGFDKRAGSDDPRRDGRRYGTVQDFDRIYRDEFSRDLPDIIARHKRERHRFFELIVKHLGEVESKSPRILEIGCGTAIDSLVVTERVNCRACGVDLSSEALRVARKISGPFRLRIDLVNADIHHLPFADEWFDMVFSQGVLEHFENVDPILEEQLRVLKPEGRLVISVPQKYTAYTIAKHRRIRKGSWPWGYETEFSYRDLQTIGRRWALSEKDVIGYGYWLHPLEPLWILRSLMRKIRKFFLFQDSSLFEKASKSYDRVWDHLEESRGHRFMRDIAIVFQKT